MTFLPSRTVVPRGRFDLPFRLTVVAAVMFWLGGFTFYGSVVIPTAHDVLGSHLEVGFITQAVTFWINVGGSIAVALLLVNLLCVDRSPRWSWRCLWATWVIIAAAQAALFILHPSLDALLDAKEHDFIDRVRFDHLHHIYLNIATAQWFAAVMHVGMMLAGWRREDRSITTQSRYGSDPS